MPHFTEDSLRRIIVNPFYAITVASQLTEEHEPSMDEAEWVRTNATLIGEMGSASWLRQLLDMLESKAGAPQEPINPFQAVNIDPLFAAEHPFRVLRACQGAPATPWVEETEKEALRVKGWHLRPKQRQEFSMNGNGTSMIDNLSIIGSNGYLHGYLERGETR